MTWGSKYWKGPHCSFCQHKSFRILLVLVSCLIISSPYFISEITFFENYQFVAAKYLYPATKNTGDFLVWNPKCHILARNPRDPSIMQFVKAETFQGCATIPPLTRIGRTPNGTGSILKIDKIAAAKYPQLSCCWAPVYRQGFAKDPPRDIDSQIRVDACTQFKTEVNIPESVEIVLVKCEDPKQKAKKKPLYSNIHPILGSERVREKLNSKAETVEPRKLSVLILGIDTMSRLNLKRTMPKTETHLRRTGWIELQGYNKMGENTFPNLMAILSGLNQSEAYVKCAPTVPYMLDRCPLIWHNFHNSSYVTAYGEDTTDMSTFNYFKVGFVDPPTDYYLRPYMVAAEKLLETKTRSNNRFYCTGPEPSMERIFNYAEEFAKTFIGTPYFGFFWTNSMSHDDLNGLSAVDDHMLGMFRRLELEGVLNDSMVIFLSDHGARYGPIRETFQGWYEDRLPFLYVWLPEWFRTRDNGAAEALRTNANRLASPFDLHETLRDVLTRAGGEVAPAEGCPGCHSLFRPIAINRSCEDAGVTPHWCACTAFKPDSTHDAIAIEGIHKFLEHVNSVISNYKNKKGKRLCSPLKLKRIIRIEENMDVDSKNGTLAHRIFLCLLQVKPGDGKFEVTIRYQSDGTFVISETEVSRINVYGDSAKCLSSGNKNYCHCL